MLTGNLCKSAKSADDKLPLVNRSGESLTSPGMGADSTALCVEPPDPFLVRRHGVLPGGGGRGGGRGAGDEREQKVHRELHV